MRIVRWHPQERVDKPDLDAVSYGMLGEFRRTLRALVQGEDSFIVTGFVVEPSAVPDTQIRVRLQPPGEERASALGSELTGAGLDKGQLIGDRDSSFLNEGAASKTLDFAIQPVGSYTVELRLVYADAVDDNRAFWNAGGATEVINNVKTRTAPSWEIQFVAGAPSGGQWIPLATVAWGGAVVNSGDITDIRELLWEGTYPFQQATQTGSGGVEDFARAATRGAQATGLHRLRSFARGVLRQVQDIKGQNDAGVFDWFSRVFSPYDPADALGAQTKTMRTIDTVTYTVGDGVTTFGDFNGATGLNACLAHLDALAAASVPERVEIVLHGGVTYTLSGSKSISGGLGNPLTIVIRAGQTLAQGNAGTYGRPRVEIDGASLAVSSYALAVAGSGLGSLTLRDIDVTWTGTTAGGRGAFATTGALIVERCNLLAGTTPAVDAGYTLSSANARRSAIRHSTVVGRVQFYDDDASGSAPVESEGGVIEHCRIDSAQVVLRADAAGAPGRDMVNGFTIRNTFLQGRGTAIYTGSIALIDARSARKFRVLDCTINYGTNENAIDGRTYSTVTPFDWRVEGCRFDDGAANGAVHAVGAGSGGADGTGWAINFSAGSHIKLRDNRYAISTSVDAGAVRLSEVSRYTIDSDEHVGCGHTAGGTNRYDGYLLTGTADGCTIGSMKGVGFGDWATGVTRVRCVNADLGRLLTIDAGSFVGREAAFGTAIAPDAGYGALRIGEFGRIAVTAHFDGWAAGTANSRTVLLDGSSDGVKLRSCTFDACGGFSLVRTSGTPTTIDIDDCTVTNTTSGADGFDLTNTIEHRITNCTFVLSGGGTRQAIVLGANNFLVMGNRALNADIHNPGTAYTGRGFNEAGQNLNLVNAYSV